MKAIRLFHAAAAAGILTACNSSTTTEPAVKSRSAARGAVGAIPADVASWFATAIGATTYDLLSYDSEKLPVSGRTIHRIKALSIASQTPIDACFTEVGERLQECGENLREKEQLAYWSAHGTLDLVLEKRLAALGLDETVPVGIWLRATQVLPPKEALIGRPDALAKAQDARSTTNDAAKERLLAELSLDIRAKLRLVSDAPAAVGELKAKDIWLLRDSPSIARMYLLEEGHAATGSPSWVATIGATGSGYSGSGVNVCIVEDRLPAFYTNAVWASIRCSGTAGTHSGLVGGILRDTISPYGAATGANLYMANWAGCPTGAAEAMAWCPSPVWNLSYVFGSGDVFDNLLVDYHVKYSPYPFIAAASGNTDYGEYGSTCPASCVGARGYVQQPSYNTSIVGGSFDCGDSGRANDTIFCDACDLNFDGRELPHLVAPATQVLDDGTTVHGTSVASPQVAAGVAQLYQANSNLANWPEAARSIIMNGADETVFDGPLSLGDAIDDRDGAGELNIPKSLQIGAVAAKVDGGNVPGVIGHDYGTISQSTTPAHSFYNEVYHVKTPYTARRLRVVLNWDASVTCTDPGSSGGSCVGATLDADLDIHIFNASTGHLVNFSATSVNSYEFIEFPVESNVEYLVKIYVYAWNSKNTYFGLSYMADYFSTD